MRTARAFLAVAVLAGLASCAVEQMAMLGPRRPARPVGCPVQIVPGTPPFPVTDLASVRVKCLETDRGDCLVALRRQTCTGGGDTVYALSESVDQHVTYIAATVALRNQPESPAGGSAAAPGCVPICSPGFDCQAGRCIPLCNPACGPTEICNVHRTCEPR